MFHENNFKSCLPKKTISQKKISKFFSQKEKYPKKTISKVVSPHPMRVPWLRILARVASLRIIGGSFSRRAGMWSIVSWGILLTSVTRLSWCKKERIVSMVSGNRSSRSLISRDTRTWVVQCVAVWCSVVQCGAVCCSVLQCGALRCSVLQCGAVYCSVVQCGAVWCSVVQCGSVWCSVLQCGAVWFSALQSQSFPATRTPMWCSHVAVCCSVLQCVAVCCRTCSMSACIYIPHCRALQCIAVYCGVLQCVEVCCSVYGVKEERCRRNCSVSVRMWMHSLAVCCDVLQCVAVCCNVLQCVAVCCSVLQRAWGDRRQVPPDLLRVFILNVYETYMLSCVVVCCSVL